MKKYSELDYQEQLDAIETLRNNEEDFLIEDTINDRICVECGFTDDNCWCDSDECDDFSYDEDSDEFIDEDGEI